MNGSNGYGNVDTVDNTTCE